ncbi:phage tail protein [Rouxiella sp. T17]|uniref:phage tail-collar fiber domain-containing protein n=1 Tax=Rouxiella sp. T17 TaxID=3085684 RepID=UPI002FC5F907
MAKFYSVITHTGRARAAEAITEQKIIVLSEFIVGDGGGYEQVPDANATKLVNEVYRGYISSLKVSPAQDNQMMAMLVLPSGIGGFTIREIGLLTDQGELYAIANCAALEKPISGVSINLQFRLAVSDTQEITLDVSTGDGLFLRVDQNGADIENKPEFLKNIGVLGTEYPIGAPIPWPSNILPTGSAMMAGQIFDTDVYPHLAFAYPNGIIPDLRGLVIKGTPSSGRVALSFEIDEVKSHQHDANIWDTDLGRKTASWFDYGSRATSEFDYGTKGSDVQGTHDHLGGVAGPGAKWADWRTGTDNTGWYEKNRTNIEGAHAHSVYIGAHTHTTDIGGHNHYIDMGFHSHNIQIASFGQLENTVKNIAFNYIVRLA